MNHALNQETQLGTLILLQELWSQLMLKPHLIQDMLSIYKLTQLQTPVLTQTRPPRLMSHAVNQETQLGTPILLQELWSQLMLKPHHTQDMLFIYKLTQQLTPVLTQTRPPRLMSHAVNQETLPGTPILLQELWNQLMLKPHHIQDMPFIYKLTQLLIPVLTQTKLPRLTSHAQNQETQHGTHILLLEHWNQLMLKPHHTQDTLFTEENNDHDDQKKFV